MSTQAAQHCTPTPRALQNREREGARQHWEVEAGPNVLSRIFHTREV